MEDQVCEDDEAFIEKYLSYYSDTQGVLPGKIEEFGKEYREQGYLSRSQLYEIAYDSSTRSAYHVNKNTKKECKEISADVLNVESDLSKIGLMCLLSGFKAPTASCVLTALNPDRHAIVDTRVWASLERLGYFDELKESFGPRHYVKMIKPIREISDSTGYTCAEAGYALFAFDDKVREGNLH